MSQEISWEDDLEECFFIQRLGTQPGEMHLAELECSRPGKVILSQSIVMEQAGWERRT